MRHIFLYITLLATAASAVAGEKTYTTRVIAESTHTGDNGPAVTAILVQPEGICTDAQGNIYVADPGDHRVRKIDSRGMITSVAGTGKAGFSGDGSLAAKADLRNPYDVAADARGNLYIADLGSARVRQIRPDGSIATVVGGGTATAEYHAGRRGTEVQLIQPRNLAVDAAGNLYISDFGAHRVLMLDRSGSVWLIAGSGEQGYTGDGGLAPKATLNGPAGIGVSASGELFVADSGNRRIRRIVAHGIRTLTNSEGAPIELATPTGVAVDSMDNVLIGDNTDVITTVSASGLVGMLPLGANSVAIDKQNRILFAAGKQVRRSNGSAVSAIAGTGFGSFSGDGLSSGEWRFGNPSGLARGADGNLYIADTGSSRVRRLTREGYLTTHIHSLSRPTALIFDAQGRLYVAESGANRIRRHDGRVLTSFSTGSVAKPFNSPTALAWDRQERLVVADTGNNLIRRVEHDGTVTTIAGGAGLSGDGNALQIKLAGPAGLAFDSDGNLWFTESGSGKVRKLDVTGKVTTLAETTFAEPRAIAIARDGTMYVSDAGTGQVFAIDLARGWWPIAGNGGRGSAPVSGKPALESSFAVPTAILLEDGGRITFADAGLSSVYELAPDSAPVDPTDPVVEPPPAPITLPGVNVIHAALGTESAVAPGQLVYLRGKDLIDAGHSSPIETEVKFGGRPLAIVAAKADELIAVVGTGIAPGLHEVVVIHRGKERARGAVEVSASAPGLFTAAGGQLLALNEDGTLNGPDRPAARGSVVAVFGTGDGGAYSGISAEIGSYGCEVVWAGPAPGQPGLFQTNLRTPAGFAPSGVQRFTLRMGTASVQDGLTIAAQ